MTNKQSETTQRPRIAASSYLNTAPLIWSFIHRSPRHRVQLLTDAAPARCATMLARGMVDVALVPVIEYQRMAGVEVVPGVCVGARRAVRSVTLVTRGMELREVRRVSLDVSSRTSAALVEIIFREFVGQVPEFTPGTTEVRAMLETHDAALVIGDPAMTFAREDLRVYDLASVWREFTGLGFVFAMWMARTARASLKRARTVDFASAREEGLSHVEEIAEDYARQLGLPPVELISYLRENICFELDEEMRAGLDLYYQLAEKHQLTGRARPLKILST